MRVGAGIHRVHRMASRRWLWTGGTVVVLGLIATAGFLVVRDPLLIPGDHSVQVYALNDRISTEVDAAPGMIGRATGMCDADSYYARDGDRKLCLVLNGPLGDTRASRADGTVTVAASEVGKLKQMATKDTGTPGETTTLVLMAGKPAALIPVTSLADGKPVKVPALR
jgi:hypothetical protein